MSGGLIQFLVKMACPAKQEWSTDAVTIDYALYDFVDHPTFELGSMLVMRILNQIKA